jgi:phospholipid/cholesterol/gamma-HCH transport system ATP-binding protein
VLAGGLGLTVFVVTHDVDLLISIADRVIALAAGRVIADGPVGEVRRAADPWLREYFSLRA